MARRCRLFVEATPQHLIQRGNNRTEIFRSPSDYEAYLFLMRDAAARFALHIHAYVLMTNHVHLMATAQSSSVIPAVMHRVGTRYAQFFNRRYARTGTLFEGRYRSLLIDTDDYWYACMRYIEQNPVRAGLAQSPAAYRWSSFRSNGLGLEDRLVVPHHLYLRLGITAGERCQSWKQFCDTTLSDAELTEMRLAVQVGAGYGPVPSDPLPDGIAEGTT